MKPRQRIPSRQHISTAQSPNFDATATIAQQLDDATPAPDQAKSDQRCIQRMAAELEHHLVAFHRNTQAGNQQETQASQDIAVAGRT